MGYMTLGYENIFTIFIAIISFIIVFSAQMRINNAYKTFKKIKQKNNLTGFEVARRILDANGLEKVHIVETKGSLTDHYDPARKVVRLSHEVFHGDSIASISVAAHEVGHALQDKNNYFMLRLRSILVPIVNFVSFLGYFAILISIFAGAFAFFTIGIIILLATLLFQLVTLPVEFNASNRAIKELKKHDLIEVNEEPLVKKMLDAAALTYVASLISTLLSILRLILMARDRD